MTKDELRSELTKLKKMEREESSELRSKGLLSGLDGPVTSKYTKLIKELFERYEKEKED